MSMFSRRLAVLALVVAGAGTGIAQAQSVYDPQSTPAPPVTSTTVLPTTVVRVPPTPQARADKLVGAVSGAFNGITRKNLIHGTKITLAVDGGGSAIVQLEVAKKGSKTYKVVGKLHFDATGTSKKFLFKIGKVGQSRLVGAASKGKSFKVKVVVAIYSARGTAKSTKTISVKG